MEGVGGLIGYRYEKGVWGVGYVFNFSLLLKLKINFVFFLF